MYVLQKDMLSFDNLVLYNLTFNQRNVVTQMITNTALSVYYFATTYDESRVQTPALYFLQHNK
jgi:hypothetical protein